MKFRPGSDTLPVLCLHNLTSICPLSGLFPPQSNKKYHKSSRFPPRDYVRLILTGPRFNMPEEILWLAQPMPHVYPMTIHSVQKDGIPRRKGKEETFPRCLQQNPPSGTSFPPPDLPGCLTYQRSCSSFRTNFIFILLSHSLIVLPPFRLTLFTPLYVYRSLCF